MLEGVFAPERPLTPFSTTYRFRIVAATHGFVPKSSRRSSGGLFAPVNGVAEHLRHRVVSPEKMHLETVGLLLCPGLCVDTPDVWF